MSIPPPEAEWYLPTLVTVHDGGRWVSGFDFASRRGRPVHVITAWNPGDERPSLDTNRLRNDQLKVELETMGFEVFAALGSDPHSEHAEESLAVVGMSDEQATEVGCLFDQVAIFRIEASSQHVLGCSANWAVSRPRSARDS